MVKRSKQKEQMEPEQINVSLGITKVNVLGYSQNETAGINQSDHSKGLEYKTTYNFRLIEEEKSIACLLEVDVNVIESKEELASITVECVFKVSPYDKVVQEKGKGQYDVKDILLINLANITTSTTRGILYERLRGAINTKDIFPLINVPQIFKNAKEEALAQKKS